MATSQGSWLKSKRLEKGLKQTQVAKASGVKQELISQYERGVKNPGKASDPGSDLSKLVAFYEAGSSEAPRYRKPNGNGKAAVAKKGSPQEVLAQMIGMAAELGDPDLVLDLAAKMENLG